MSHYFINDDSLKKELKYINYTFKGNTFKFATHAGIFSKEHVDGATDILLNTISAVPVRATTGTAVLDMGCGYGCIGIVLAKTYSLKLTATDINPAAVELTRLNCKLNGVEADVTESDGFNRINGDFDAIVINPPIHAGKSVTYKMYEDSIKHLTAGGKLYVVTFKKHGAESTLAKIREVFDGRTEVIYKKKGIYVIAATS